MMLRRWLWALMALGAGGFVVGALFSEVYTEALWFAHLGYRGVFWKMLGIKALSFWILGGAAFIFLWANVKAAGEGRLWLLAALLGALIGTVALPSWERVLLWAYRVPFGLEDPIFGRDLGFYLFSLPFYRLLYQIALLTTLLALASTGSLYLMGRGVQIGPLGPKLSLRASRHLSFLVGVFLLEVVVVYALRPYFLLYSRRGVVSGAGYADLHGTLWGYRFLLVGFFAGAVRAFWNMRRPRWRGMGYWAAGLSAGIFVLIVVLPGLIQQFSVKPSELAKERPYIAYNIRHTRIAYGLDRVREASFPAEKTPTPEELERGRATISNIRLWDHRPLIQTYKQLQEIRLYYDFRNVDVDRYRVNGGVVQVMLAARELTTDKLPERARTWVNRRLKFTHGYGICMSPVNSITPEGMPVLWIRDIPPKSRAGLDVLRPGLYYGEASGGYVLVRTKTPEFDYPMGDRNVYTTYEGKGGVPVGGFLRRSAFAWRFSDLKFLLSEYITPESRVLFHRRVSKRVRRVAPFLIYDQDPYIVLADGRLFWIVDVYTTADTFPYSEPVQFGRRRINFIRNSCKAVVDAYDGRVRFYIVDPEDPVLRTYRRAFPELFRPLSEMPSSLREHLRYPLDLFSVQVRMYSLYHMRDPQVFYNQEDLWAVPYEIYEESRQEMVPYYVVMRLPGEEKQRFLLMLPLTPSSKPNMVAWMGAHCDPDRYGELMVYKLPKEKLIYGPMQVEARIDQDTEISREFTLWGQKGSSVIRGNLLAIPIGRSFLYVEPVYLQSTGSRMPELKRVIVAIGDRLAMRPTLREALDAVFGREPAAPEERPELARRALLLYERALENLREGDWAGYGEKMKELGEVLRKLGGRARRAK
ncbi:MAG TPA: UPF0182 family protein [Candidatus Latescibacteria bacterium]|nr:UPF0182 family protein [Candidatus Latescibacterota bacterium]